LWQVARDGHEALFEFLITKFFSKDVLTDSESRCWPIIVGFATKLGRLDWLQSFALTFSDGSESEGRISYMTSAAVEAAKYRQSAILRWAMDALSDSEVNSSLFRRDLVKAALVGGNIALMATLVQEGFLDDISPVDCIRCAFECSDVSSMRFIQKNSLYKSDGMMWWVDFTDYNQATDTKIAIVFDEAKWLDRTSRKHFPLACARGDLSWIQELMKDGNLSPNECQQGFRAAIRHSKWDAAALIIENNNAAKGFPSFPVELPTTLISPSLFDRYHSIPRLWY